MKLERLPTSPTENPMLLGAYDAEKNKVVWAMNGDALYDSPMFMDGTNWFNVWRINDVVHCQATQWYHPRGDFYMGVTDLSPDQAVAMADQAARIASAYFDGDKELEKTS